MVEIGEGEERLPFFIDRDETPVANPRDES